MPHKLCAARDTGEPSQEHGPDRVFLTFGKELRSCGETSWTKGVNIAWHLVNTVVQPNNF